MKKWKNKGFSVGVNRELIASGAALLGMSLEQVITLTIEGMRSIAAKLNLG
jgi:predicted hydrolase (HD superfamily)